MSRHPNHSPNGYDFEVDGRKVLWEGKLHWHDCLTVWIDRRDALQTIAYLANALQEDIEKICLSYCGKLEQTEFGTWPFDENGEELPFTDWPLEDLDITEEHPF